MIEKNGSKKHQELCRMGIEWLYYRGCSVFANEVPTRNGVADALGIITRNEKRVVYYIEAKASRSDLIGAKQKRVYERSILDRERFCVRHSFKQQREQNEHKDCEDCYGLNEPRNDTGIDFYYFIVADGVKVEKKLYPNWGVINKKGTVIRRAKNLKSERKTDWLIENIAHKLVYKVYGKLYF